MQQTPLNIPAIPQGRELTLLEVAQALGCTDRKLRQLVEAGNFSPGHNGPGGLIWWEGDVAVYRYRLFRGDFQDLPDEEEGPDGGGINRNKAEQTGIKRNKAE